MASRLARSAISAGPRAPSCASTRSALSPYFDFFDNTPISLPHLWTKSYIVGRPASRARESAGKRRGGTGETGGNFGDILQHFIPTRTRHEFFARYANNAAWLAELDSREPDSRHPRRPEYSRHLWRAHAPGRVCR